MSLSKGGRREMCVLLYSSSVLGTGGRSLSLRNLGGSAGVCVIRSELPPSAVASKESGEIPSGMNNYGERGVCPSYNRNEKLVSERGEYNGGRLLLSRTECDTDGRVLF